MYCPKCKETFEEGSRRFCPTDGTRLVSETAAAQTGGIFSGILAKNQAARRDEAAFAAESDLDLLGEGKRKATKVADSYFELDDLLDDAEMPEPPTPPIIEPKPVARKVNPFEIPKGHVDLGDTERSASVFNDFDVDDPVSFVGRTVKGRYQVTEYLGGDETGIAYIAVDRIVGDKKVLVRILIEDDSDAMMSSIMAEERVSLSHLSHPNIARLIDSGAFTNGIGFLVSEYYDALSARHALGIHGRFPAERAARIIKQAAYALSEAHQEGILHRDLRPENFILADADQLVLVNFGASDGEPNHNNAAYKAPEVLDGRVSTAASDVYSLALVAYEMLTGSRPFKGSSTREFLKAQYAGVSELASNAAPGVPSSVDEVFEKALSYKAAGRYSKAREFGDAFAAALADAPAVETPVETHVEEPAPIVETPVVEEVKAKPEPKIEVIKPIEPAKPKPIVSDEPAWKNRSPEPPQEESPRSKTLAIMGIIGLLALLALGWWYVVNNPSEQGVQTGQNTNQSTTPTISSDVETPPQPRKILQPPNTDFFQSNKQNVRGDLLRNFVGFSLYYPKDWKVIGPQASAAQNSRGKFVDISRSGADGKLREQMLVSYYPSKGTFNADADKFSQMVKETNDTLKNIVPGYQMVSEGEIKLNGDWRAYEVKFQGNYVTETGEKLSVWGRRIFLPAARAGVRNGFEITMLATSASDQIASVDDVGVKGELAPILYSFEPGQNF